MDLTSNISINQTICGCDGGISIYTYDGYPPYSYSIDNGITFSKMPIFSNLCEGNYVIIVNDISGNTTTSFATLNRPSKPIAYTVYLKTSSQVINKSPNKITTEYKTYINVFPELSSGTIISFKLNHSNLFKSSPNEFSSSGTSTSQLLIDTIEVPISSSGTTTATTFNSIPGCQNNTLYLTTYNEEWSTINYTFGTEFELTTIDVVNKNEFNDCYVSDSQHNFSISNLSISGCNCCTVVTS